MLCAKVFLPIYPLLLKSPSPYIYIQFISGLGPRKADALLKSIRDAKEDDGRRVGRVKSREHVRASPCDLSLSLFRSLTHSPIPLYIYMCVCVRVFSFTDS